MEALKEISRIYSVRVLCAILEQDAVCVQRTVNHTLKKTCEYSKQFMNAVCITCRIHSVKVQYTIAAGYTGHEYTTPAGYTAYECSAPYLLQVHRV
jgi:hypothetical protein